MEMSLSTILTVEEFITMIDCNVEIKKKNEQMVLIINNMYINLAG